MAQGAIQIDESKLAVVAAILAERSVRNESGCLIWTGYTQPNGYGWLNYRGIKIAAHRASLLVAGAAVSHGMDVCHRCDVRNCIEPAHLYVGTRRQNMADCTARRRHNKPTGARHWCSKLSDEDVRAIRALTDCGHSQTSVAAKFNVHSATVSRIARRVWRGEVA